MRRTLATLALLLLTATAEAAVTRTERSGRDIHSTHISLRDEVIAITDATTAGAHGSVKLMDFPAGMVRVLAMSSDLAIVDRTAGDGLTTTSAVVCAVGSTAAGVDDATLTTTEADFMPSTTATFSSKAGACDGQMTTALDAIFDGTATAVDLFLNLATPDAGSTDDADDTVTVNGSVTVVWISAGDN